MIVRRVTAAAAGLLLAATTLVAGSTEANASGSGPGWYGIWANGVAVRADSNDECDLYPGPGNCPHVLERLNAGQIVYVHCQKATGTVVGGNPYWLWVHTLNSNYGWIASYYTDNPTNRIDGLADCS
jgi:hypothetical protein